MFQFKELKDKAANMLQRTGADSTYKDELGDWINLLLEGLYKRYDFFDELKNDFTFTTVDGTAKYFLPFDFGKAYRVYDITNNKKLKPTVEPDYFDANIANIADSVEADAETYYFKEVVGVKVQVSTSGDTVQAKSSSASDTSVVVRVEGYLDSGLTILGFENITVTGTTAVAGTTTFYKITHYSKASDSIGYITLEDSSANGLGILQDIDRVARYKAINLRLIPDDSATSIQVLYKKKFRRLVDNNDYPFVEADDYLIFGAAALATNRDKESIERVAFLDKEKEKALSLLLLDQTTKLGTDYQHKMEATFIQAHRA